MSILNRVQAPAQQEIQTPTSLKEIDAEKELLLQFTKAKQLLNEATEDTSMQHKVSALNSITAIIQQISKTQVDLYNAEKIKLIELTLLATLKEFPEMEQVFMEKYTEALK